jgi:single-stranded-DNA-specific exonuclease
MREFLKSAVGLAAMGTVADIVPMVGENRILVHYGLEMLREKSTPGLAMLLKIAGLDQSKQLTAEDIGFSLAPRINAAGRLGQARLAVELLTTENRERAVQLAEYVDQLNKNRQSVERRIFKEAKEQVEANGWEDQAALVLASSDWHPGVIGIVANKIAERFEKPAIMIAINQETQLGQGSGRTYANFDLHSGLAACQEYLEGFGGHRAAAGIKIRSHRIDEFREAFSEHVRQNHRVKARDVEVQVDAEVSLADLTHRGVQELEILGPFGAEHRRPVFVASGVELEGAPSTMGTGERHLSLRVRQAGKVLRCVGFGKADWIPELASAEGKLAICFSAGINRYKGYESVELQLIDWQPESELSGTGSVVGTTVSH